MPTLHDVIDLFPSHLDPHLHFLALSPHTISNEQQNTYPGCVTYAAVKSFPIFSFLPKIISSASSSFPVSYPPHDRYTTTSEDTHSFQHKSYRHQLEGVVKHKVSQPS